MAVLATLRASTLERPKETDTAAHMCPTKDHLHHIAPQTHAHKRHKLLGTGTFPNGAMSVSGERNQNPDPPRCLQAKQLAGFRDINSPEMLVILNPWALVDTRCYWCYCFCLFRFHPLLLGGAIAIGCPHKYREGEGPLRSVTTRKGKWGTKKHAACWNLPLSWEAGAQWWGKLRGGERNMWMCVCKR